jgi:hypothetical protein
MEGTVFCKLQSNSKISFSKIGDQTFTRQLKSVIKYLYENDGSVHVFASSKALKLKHCHCLLQSLEDKLDHTGAWRNEELTEFSSSLQSHAEGQRDMSHLVTCNHCIGKSHIP